MTISLSDAGKRFNREWIFRHFSYQFIKGRSYAITGANGSGKSTLLQVLSGSMHFNEGKCEWKMKDVVVAPEKVFQHISICAPYLEVVEEMTVTEFLEFHRSFKTFLPGITTKQAIEMVGLKGAADKQIRYYSSGMKQRVKLAQCILSDTALVLLDEPCTNLDLTGIDLYNELIEKYCKERLVIVCSNDKTEYGFCKEIISIMDYK